MAARATTKRATTTPSTKASGQRAGRGRFVKGWKGGPGRPTKAAEESYAAGVRRVVHEQELEAILKALLAKAKCGDVRAAAEILKRAVPEQLAHNLNQPTEINLQVAPGLLGPWAHGDGSDGSDG